MTNTSTLKFTQKKHNEEIVLSVVVPVFNEADNIKNLLSKLSSTLQSIEPNHEIILVDDGSEDATAQMIVDQRGEYPNVKLIRLSRNFGKEAALNAGLSNAGGQAVIQIDGDLQHPPELIAEFVDHWRNGSEIVYGERQSRKTEGLAKWFLAKVFYRIFSNISDVQLMKGLGDFLLMDRKVVDALLSLPERERFTKGLYAWVGFERKAVPFEVVERMHGQSGWSLIKLFAFAVSAITSFGTIPLRVWSYLGLLLAVPSFLYGFFTILKTIIYGIDVPGYPSLMVAVCFFSGLQLFGIGILGEYLGQVLKEVKKRPLYLISEKLGFDEEQKIIEEKDNVQELAS